MKKEPIDSSTIVHPFVPNDQHISVATQHNNNYRTGWNNAEAHLTASNVNAQSFGKLFSLKADDQVYAQPLIAGGLKMDSLIHNVAYIATVNNTVYAYDADNGNLFWKKNYTQSGMRPPLNSDMGLCGSVYSNISRNIGIIGTPVIDSHTKVMYFVARSTDGNNYVQYLHAVDIITGNERSGSPVKITASVSGTGDGSEFGSIEFNGKTQNQRQALTLVNGRIYISWASHCDMIPYHGWIMGYNASTLQQEIVYIDTPDGGDGGIWESGTGLAADEAGNLYASVGNGTVSLSNNTIDVRNISEGVLKLASTGSKLQVVDYFVPYNYATLDSFDLDFGSLGSLLVPNSNYFFTGCKNGNLYLLDKDNLGGFNPLSDQVHQSLSLNRGDANEHCQAAYYKGALQEFIYVWSENDRLKAFPFNAASGLINEGSIILSPVNGPAGQTGAMLSVSSNGNNAGTGILWATFPLNCDAEDVTCPGVLYAFDAEDVTHVLWNSNSAGYNFSFAKFASPTIANGHVYVPTFSGYVDVYGIK
jgi:outer membrane protein assembly factor BamB